jgi:hypothetical protein
MLSSKSFPVLNQVNPDTSIYVIPDCHALPEHIAIKEPSLENIGNFLLSDFETPK